ncbi:MAG: hypothetical protein EB059_05300 [Alphaproteobacteria bacterium]|nr:hypothetical protein [Alphaproteobacteria bacterium]
MKIIFAALCALFLCLSSNPSFAEANSNLGVSIFPPTGCNGQSNVYMSWDGVNSTACTSGQSILSDTLNCTEGQQVVFEGGKYTCKSPTVVTIPTCTAEQYLSYDGMNYTCKSMKTPNCTAKQVLTNTGGGLVCIDQSAAAKTCKENEFLTYNGSEFQCATQSLPNCKEDQYLTSINHQAVCKDLADLANAQWVEVDLNSTDDFDVNCSYRMSLNFWNYKAWSGQLQAPYRIDVGSSAWTYIVTVAPKSLLWSTQHSMSGYSGVASYISSARKKRIYYATDGGVTDVYADTKNEVAHIQKKCSW